MMVARKAQEGKVVLAFKPSSAPSLPLLNPSSSLKLVFLELKHV